MPGLEIAQIFIKHTANAATKVLTFPPMENRPSKVIWKVFLYLYFCHVYLHPQNHWYWTSIIFLTGYRHFHLKKGKVKQGFIYENAQKKMLENCNFCPGKSLKSPWFCSTKKCMNPSVHVMDKTGLANKNVSTCSKKIW